MQNIYQAYKELEIQRKDWLNHEKWAWTITMPLVHIMFRKAM
jgi:hypothetical protein